MDPGFDGRLGFAVLVEDLVGGFLAGTTVGRNAEYSLQTPKVAHAGLRRLADLLVSDGVANTDVHKFSQLGA